MKKIVIVITGATAIGKSDIAEQVAENIGGEIINADIGSLYTPLNIGTAKPDLRHSKISHHLFNIFDTPQNFTMVEFRKKIQVLIKEVWQRGKIPIVVGGSAFYIKVLWYKSLESGSSSIIEQNLIQSTENVNDLWQQLFEIDPIRAQKIGKNDRYRIVRALEIYKITGQKPSNFEPIYDPLAPILGIFCIRNRQALYERINQRVQKMLQSGWIEEVAKLLDTHWEQFLIDKKIIGYDDIIFYLKSEKTLQNYQNLVAVIQKKTRNYAKRQITFLSKLQKDIQADKNNNLHKIIINEINVDVSDLLNIYHTVIQCANDFKQ